jgi:NADH dehydrogenase FAD-containing subunit
VMPLTSHGYFLHRVLRKSGTLLLGTKVTEITSAGAMVDAKGESRFMEADTIVWAVGSISERALEEAARDAGIMVVTAGDAEMPQRLLDAVHGGYKAARKLLYGDDDQFQGMDG